MNPFELWAMLGRLWHDALYLVSLWPWFLGVLVAGYVLGAWLGWKGSAVIAAVAGMVAWFARNARRDDEPAWTNGEPGEKPVKRYRVPPRRRPTVPKSLVEND